MMKFDENLLRDYQHLLQTTNLQKCSREFHSLFRSVRNELEKAMPDYQFQKDITEKCLEYSYFQFTNPVLKDKGLKIVVLFVHQSFQFEVLLSGYNREVQSRVYETIKGKDLEFELCSNPSKEDFILRSPLPPTLIFEDLDVLVSKLKTNALALFSVISN